MKRMLFCLVVCLTWGGTVPALSLSGYESFDTGYTISKVRSAQKGGRSYIVASSYEGTVLGIDYDGTVLWQNPLSGFMNRDLWCADINGDETDEILAANADGTLTCLSSAGKRLWQFKANDAPMNAVCVLHHAGKRYVVCGGYDNSIYILSPAGKRLKVLHSSTYSIEKSWGKGHKPIPPSNRHVANFIRPLRRADGMQILAVLGTLNSNQTRGSVYLFEPLAEKPFTIIPIKAGKSYGDFRVCDLDGDGNDEILMGTSSMIQDATCIRLDIAGEEQTIFPISKLRRKIDGFGYRVVQPEFITDGSTKRCLILFGSRLLLLEPDLDIEDVEVLVCKYAFNDMWQDPLTHKVILASSQSGGSCIHVLDPRQPDWKQAYSQLSPGGKIRRILDNTQAIRDRLETFKQPGWEREPLPVYLMTESVPASLQPLVAKIEKNCSSPIFLNGFHMPKAEDWDRSSLANEAYRKKRDRRKNYSLTQRQVLDQVLPEYQDAPGVAFWGGHGNDPYMISLPTLKKILDAGQGKKTVLIYPELEQYDKGFTFVMEDHIYPLAQYCRGRNANVFVRTKHTFWQSIVYMPLWSRLISGEFADVFVPSMEETTDKSMELSLAARTGLWASGAVDGWGTRCARDNPSYDRLRQHSHQMLPNHFLRTMVYHIASGAQYINNFPVDQAYMSLLWELIAKGALYVPKRSEIVSFSPVHLSMTAPEEHHLHEGNNVKWITFYDEAFEKDNTFVFSRLNGTWPGAPVTQWDFSRYAADVKERRLNFLAPFPHGRVLITPPQQGIFADKAAPRGRLRDHLHPLYKNILKEYYTDGRFYLSADGTKRYDADQYYRSVEVDIKERCKFLPLTVSGEVAWVVAQTAPTHLRLTVVDGGYINPNARTAIVTFHALAPKKMIDLLDGTSFDVTHPKAVKVEVPCGSFRFIDIELKNPLGQESPGRLR